MMTDRVTGMIMAALTPATTRTTIMNVEEGASAAAAVATTNTARPASRTGLRPQRSPMAPTGISMAASASA